MIRRSALALVGLSTIAIGTTGCLQWGEYAMGSECEDLSVEIADVVTQAYGVGGRIERLWAGESDVWCSFDVVTETDLPREAPERADVRARVQDLLEKTFTGGVEVTLVYARDEDFAVLDTRENIDRAACADIADRVVPLVADRLGDQVQLSSFGDDMENSPDSGCSIRVVTGWDPTSDAELRVKTAEEVKAVLPENTEVHLIHLGANDTIRQPAQFSSGAGEASPECAETSRAVELLLRDHYGSALPLQTETGAGASVLCRFSIVLPQDIAFADPLRAEARELVRSALPPDVEAHLLYPDSRDTVVIDTRGNEPARGW